MKNIFKIWLGAALFAAIHLSSNAQIEFTRQSQVDSFLANISSTHVRTFVFRYDIGVPANDQITDLSGFDTIRKIGAYFMNFEWKDMPWFKVLSKSALIFINMPLLETISGPDTLSEIMMHFEECPKMKKISRETIPGLVSFYYMQFYNNSLDSLVVDLTDVQISKINDLRSKTIILEKNNIKNVIIWDPDLVAQEFFIEKDSTMQYLYIDGKKVGKRGGNISENSELELIRGFKTCDNCRADITYNRKLKDLCVLRDGLVYFYDNLAAHNKHLFRVHDNGLGASSIEELRAADCSWLSDTFTTVNERENQENKLQVFPNPSRGIFNLLPSGGNQIAKVYLYNLQGREIPIQVAPNAEVSMNAPNRGLYMLRVVYTTGEMETLKVMVDE
jgi:hypothetical protein